MASPTYTANPLNALGGRYSAPGRPDRQTNGQPARGDEGRPSGTSELKTSPKTNVHQHPGLIRGGGWGPARSNG